MTKKKPSGIFDASLMSSYFSALGKRSLETMTPEQRSARAKKAVQAREAKKLLKDKQ